MHDEANSAREATAQVRSESARFTSLKTRAEAWLATAPASSSQNESQSLTPATWMRRAKAQGLTVSRFSDRAGTWSASVEGTASAVATIISPRTSALTMRPSTASGRVHADLTMRPDAPTAIQLSPDDLVAFLNAQSPEHATTSSSTAGAARWNLVFRSDEQPLSPLASIPAPFTTSTTTSANGLIAHGEIFVTGGPQKEPARSEPLPLEGTTSNMTTAMMPASSVPYDYLGRIEGGTRGICGVFKSRQNGLVISVRQGETLDGWKLERVGADDVILSAIEEPSRTARLTRQARTTSG